MAVLFPQPAASYQDTSTAEIAYLDVFPGGYRALRRDGKMGLLNQDLSIRVPFKYLDIQKITTGLDESRDFVLVGRYTFDGMYATLDRWGNPTSDYTLSYNDRLQINELYIIDSPRPGQYFILSRDGSKRTNHHFSTTWHHPILMSHGFHIINVQEPGTNRLALFNIDMMEQVTPFKYQRISRVDPVIAPRESVPVLEGYTKNGIELLRPSGKVLSPITFAGVEDYNNWKDFRTYFGLPDDPRAEAVAWTDEMEVYVVYNDDTVVHLGRYERY